jgi:ribonucleoside-diphosphate reductase alpha chain
MSEETTRDFAGPASVHAFPKILAQTVRHISRAGRSYEIEHWTDGIDGRWVVLRNRMYLDQGILRAPHWEVAEPFRSRSQAVAEVEAFDASDIESNKIPIVYRYIKSSDFSLPMGVRAELWALNNEEFWIARRPFHGDLKQFLDGNGTYGARSVREAVKFADPMDIHESSGPTDPDRLTFRPFMHPIGNGCGFDHSWIDRDVEIKDDKGDVIFTQKNIRCPSTWSPQAVQVVASKYLYGDATMGDAPKTGGREQGIDLLINRVCRSVADWCRNQGYFSDAASHSAFLDDLAALMIGQYACFNSPVWFNVGLSQAYGLVGSPGNFRYDLASRRVVPVADTFRYPQVSACFIQSVDDDMASIMALATSEAMLFKHGSGTGTDLSTLRSTRERLTGGGTPSGPVSFMRIYDAVASVIKSGGKTRRAAKMQTLKCDHPNINEFVQAKAKEDRKAKALIAAGWSDRMTGHPDEAYSSVLFQNCNMSIRVTDNFMRLAVWPVQDCTYPLIAVTTGEEIGRANAVDVLRGVADGTWQCGDPGLQYEDTIQRWHTCPQSAPINSSNPCGEYNFIDESACNLASINLLAFARDAGPFDVPRFKECVRVMITAMDGLVDSASYPTEAIAQNSHDFRPLGLGHANIGAFLMERGIPYDSAEGRAWAGVLTALMHGAAALASAELAAALGPFHAYEKNKSDMLRVMRTHHFEAARRKDAWISNGIPEEIASAACDSLARAVEVGHEHGYRNSQLTLIAPTGTIAFMMDCATTGIEPELYLVKYKNLAGGGLMKIVNPSIERALISLGYTEAATRSIVSHVESSGSIDGCPMVRDSDLAVFDCSYPAAEGGRCIRPLAHVEMMAEIQPFLSGAISKTVNVPRTATVEEIESVYIKGWELGLKSLAIYREMSKGVQPLNSSDPSKAACEPAVVVGAVEPPTVEPPTESAATQAKIGFFGPPPWETRATSENSWMRGCQYIMSGQAECGDRLGLDMITGKMAVCQDAPASFIAAERLRPNDLVYVKDDGTIGRVGRMRPDASASFVASERLWANDFVYINGDGTVGRVHPHGEIPDPRREVPVPASLGPVRTRLPDTRHSITHKFSVGGHEGYITVGLYDDVQEGMPVHPGEVFITMAKEGSTVGGLMDALGTAVSIGLQYGIPLEVFISKFEHSRFEPAGFTGDKEIPMAGSLTDYVFRWLGMMFVPGYRGTNGTAPQIDQGGPHGPVEAVEESFNLDATDSSRPSQVESLGLVREMITSRVASRPFNHCPPCDACGAITVPAGRCYGCPNCGRQSGCS